MKSELEAYREQVDLVLCCSTKADAKPYISKMNFFAAQLCRKADHYTSQKIQKIADYASLAAGQARDRERHISNLEQAWYIVESELLARFDEEKNT
ncbi:hypothetical protein VINI7043_02385 [Vibrio nigripulchritudo ATCC 27043]|uniref:hypothetical protein n=1 Tax=Vibrio nigripulchritudo TaxID=28173 RepID=UPI00021C2263|nr:hypothetical protein [Vibrio nigripulchritudo]EGU60943.1 hypothetical protein VINI7043_02385 [Vibrio nigripulchritudo ATCC 27043]